MMRFSLQKRSFGRRRGISGGGWVAIVVIVVILAALIVGLARLTPPPVTSTHSLSTSHSSTGSTTKTGGIQNVAVGAVSLTTHCFPDPVTKCQSDSSNSTVKGVLQFKVYNPNLFEATLVRQFTSHYNPGAGISGPGWVLSTGACTFTNVTFAAPKSVTSFSCNLSEPNGAIWGGDNYTWYVDVDFSATAPPQSNLFQQASGSVVAANG
jgi:hypothetical protein